MKATQIPCGCSHARYICARPADPEHQCPECAAGRHDHHNRYQPDPFVPQPEHGVMYYRYRISRDIYRVPTLTTDSAEAEAIFARECKLLGGAALCIDWETGEHTWMFAARVPPEIRRNARIASALHPNTVPHSVGLGIPSIHHFQEAFPGAPLPTTDR